MLTNDRQRFNAFIDKSTDCWNWNGSKLKGYGQFNYAGLILRAHRVMFWLHYGFGPGKFSVMHTCDNPSCLNPDHLKLGTHKDNMRDMCLKKRHGRIKTTACPRGHTYDFNNTYLTKKNGRSCRKCHALAQVPYRKKLKEKKALAI